jgi:hypothetical protein
MNEPAIERVAAACPQSKYKDDRHEWHLIMHDECLIACRVPKWRYHLRRCDTCGLTILTHEFDGESGGYNEGPRKSAIIQHAFYGPKD